MDPLDVVGQLLALHAQTIQRREHIQPGGHVALP